VKRPIAAASSIAAAAAFAISAVPPDAAPDLDKKLPYLPTLRSSTSLALDLDKNLLYLPTLRSPAVSAKFDVMPLPGLPR
jgi:hypothetical protein